MVQVDNDFTINTKYYLLFQNEIQIKLCTIELLQFFQNPIYT